MDYAQESAWAETNPILSWMRSNAPEPKSTPKPVPAAIKRMILELGVRYRPASSGMLDGHNAQVAALIADVADIPPHLLERAIAEHVRSSEFMPKASSLIAKCKSYLAPKVVDSDEAEKWKRRVREGNRMLIRDNLWERSHWAFNHNGIGCSLVAGRMEPQAYNEALTVDVAILPKRAA